MSNKNKNKIILAITLGLIIITPLLIFASPIGFEQNGDVFLRIKQLDWDTFYFEPRPNLLAAEDFSYIWEFSDGHIHRGREFVKTFEPGQYAVKLTAIDFYGRFYTETANLKVKYFSIGNKWFWGFFYLFILLLIVYYWLIKLIYWANEKEIREHVDAFLESLDEVHFWKNLEKAIKSIK